MKTLLYSKVRKQKKKKNKKKKKTKKKLYMAYKTQGNFKIYFLV